MDEMLDNMTRKQFDERYALFALREHDESWRQAGTVAAAVVNAIREFLMFTGQAYFKNISLPEDHIPKFALPEEVEEEVSKRDYSNVMSLDVMEQQMASKYGVDL